MTKPYHFLCFIGRFQPLHNAHAHIIQEALKLADKVIILVGSADAARSTYNPFTFEERKRMIQYSFHDDINRLIIRGVPDHLYNDDAWVKDVQEIVTQEILYHGNNGGIVLSGLNDFKVGLIGHGKDNSSFYLKLFPQWTSVNVPELYEGLSSTSIRKNLFFWNHVPDALECNEIVKAYLRDFAKTDAYKWLREEATIDRHYNPTDYPQRIVCCVDNVVVQSGHVLLVQRKNHPGKGLWALPGGHVENDEKFKDAAIRELREETHISDAKGEIPPAMLASFITDTRLFDNPHRSTRARVISQAYLYRLPNRTKLFDVTGMDDAEKAQWVPLSSIKREEMFEDHYSIIETMLGL